MPASQPGSGTTNPPSPAMGSTTTHAICEASTLASIHAIVSVETARAAERVRERRPVDLGCVRTERLLVRHDLGGEGEPEQRAAVEGLVERDHRGPACRRARDLDRVLDGLRARVHEHRTLLVVAGRTGRELLAHRDVALVGRDLEAGVDEVGGLLRDRVDDRRVRVADVHHCDARAEIDQPVAVDVLDDPALRALHEHGQRRADAGGNRVLCDAPTARAIAGPGSRSRVCAPVS